MPHSRGEPIKLNADIQNRLEDFALSELSGAKKPRDSSPFDGAVIVRGFNASGALIDRDHVAQIGTLVLDPQSHSQARRTPCLRMDAATFPGSLGSIAIATEPVPSNKIGEFAIAGHCVAAVFVVKTTDRFATIDPTDPTRLRSSDTGEVRIVSLPASIAPNTERLCFVRFGSSPLVRWRYRRNSEFSPVAPVTIVRIDGDDFASGATVQMSDDIELMDDQTTNDIGLMDQIGATFIAVNAPCPVDSDSLFGSF